MYWLEPCLCHHSALVPTASQATPSWLRPLSWWRQWDSQMCPSDQMSKSNPDPPLKLRLRQTSSIPSSDVAELVRCVGFSTGWASSPNRDSNGSWSWVHNERFVDQSRLGVPGKMAARTHSFSHRRRRESTWRLVHRKDVSIVRFGGQIVTDFEKSGMAKECVKPLVLTFNMHEHLWDFFRFRFSLWGLNELRLDCFAVGF